MGVSSFVASVLVGVLSAFLVFPSIKDKLPNVYAKTEITVAEVQYTSETAPDSSREEETVDALPDLSVLPTIYEKQEYGGLIPQALLDAPASQNATVVLAPNESTGSTSTKTELQKKKETVAVHDAIVNVFCTMRTKNSVRATSGSGVFINDNGVILTNAHIAQFLLLSEPSRGITTKCTIRAGNPATPKYYAELLYIPPLWVNENAKQLHAEQPSGTGERDYALLYVTEAISGKLPSTFPALPPSITAFGKKSKNQVVLAAGFPAEIIKIEGPKASLKATVATTTITELFTYTKSKVDLVGIAPSAVGEQGSSGGPIVSLEGDVIGLIATRGNEETDGARSLRAITLPYIDRTIREETRVGLIDTISGNLSERARIFRETMTPLLSTIVIDELR